MWLSGLQNHVLIHPFIWHHSEIHSFIIHSLSDSASFRSQAPKTLSTKQTGSCQTSFTPKVYLPFCMFLDSRRTQRNPEEAHTNVKICTDSNMNTRLKPGDWRCEAAMLLTIINSQTWQKGRDKLPWLHSQWSQDSWTGTFYIHSTEWLLNTKKHQPQKWPQNWMPWWPTGSLNVEFIASDV